VAMPTVLYLSIGLSRAVIHYVVKSFRKVAKT
jgi:hypothetical protein